MKNAVPITAVPRTIWIDNIRVLATIAVIVLHVSAFGVSVEYNRFGHASLTWWVLNFYESLSRCCVPLFVMLTGALLLPKTTALSWFLKKRLNRIFWPFVFWTIIYIAFNLWLQLRDSKTNTNTLNNPGSWFYWQLTHGAAVHLWYVYMLIGLYLFIPIIQPWASSASNSALLYFLSIWVMVAIIRQYKLLPSDTPLNLSYFSGYLGYILLGYFIAYRLKASSKMRFVAEFCITAGFALTFYGTYLLSLVQGHFADAYYDFLSVNVILISAGVFYLFRNFKVTEGRQLFSRIRDLISRYGFGIYLCHLLVLNVLSVIKINYKLITPALGVLVTAMICLIVSTAVIHILTKLPYGKYISG